MADRVPIMRLSAGLTALRGVLMLVGGLYAVLFPALALTWLVVLGGALFLADGVLGLWSLTFGKAKTGNFWFDIARNFLAVLMGLVVLFSPVLSTIFTVTFIVYVVAIQAVIVGIMEIAMVFRAREVFATIWPIFLAGILYVLFGLVAILWPLLTAITAVVWIGVLMILFAIGLFALSWRLFQARASRA